MSIKIVILTNALGLGGTDNQIITLARQLQSRGYEIRIYTLLPIAGPMGQEAKDNGLFAGHLGMKRGQPSIRAFLQFIRIVRYERPFILHSFLPQSNILARIVHLFVPVPVQISSVRSIREGGMWVKLAYRFTDPLSTITTNVSQLGTERYIREGFVQANKIRYIPNGVDTALFRPDMTQRVSMRKELDLEDRFVWLAIGHLGPAKDYPNLIDAFAKVRQTELDTLLLIVGMGPLQDEIKSLIEKYQLSKHVRLLGARRDIPSLMNAADSYVMSSNREGMPNVLLEAAASGLPIVATSVGGTPEIVRDGKNGFLVVPQDPHQLAIAMLKLMHKSEEERFRLGQTGLEYIQQHYKLADVVGLWENLYWELLNKKNITRQI